MDDILNDQHVDQSSQISHRSHKQMKKRKQLDALLKFRRSKSRTIHQSIDVLRTSEDEFFISQQKTTVRKTHRSRYHHWWYYIRCILFLTLFTLVVVVCISLLYNNMELRNEVRNLSSRLNQVEHEFPQTKFDNLSSMIEHIQSRWYSIEHWNLSYLYDQLEKLTNEISRNKNNDFRFKSTKLINKWNQQLKYKITQSTADLSNQFDSFRHEIHNLNRSIQIQDSIVHLVRNSSDKTSVMLSQFQSHIDQLRTQIEQCKCSKVLPMITGVSEQ